MRSNLRAFFVEALLTTYRIKKMPLSAVRRIIDQICTQNGRIVSIYAVCWLVTGGRAIKIWLCSYIFSPFFAEKGRVGGTFFAMRGGGDTTV